MKGPNYIDGAGRLPAHEKVVSVGGVDLQWNKLLVVVITVPVLLALLYLVQKDSAGQGDARDGTGQGRGRDHGHQRQPDDLVHVPDRRRAGGRRRLLYPLYVDDVRFDQGFQLGLIAFTAAVLGGIGNLPGAVLGAVSIGLIQAFNEGSDGTYRARTGRSRSSSRS